jgi:molybdopterin-synthase adenylyltransferase
LSLSFAEKTRYARQLILPDFGEAAQQKLKAAQVLIVGMGGLGCPCALYLAAAGIGHLHLLDPDTVTLNNLHRQILFETSDINQPKTEAAKAALLDLNPEITITSHPYAFTTENAQELLKNKTVVVEASDSIPTRFLLAEQAEHAKIPLVSAAIHQWHGQLACFTPYVNGLPRYRDLYPEPPPAEAIPSCAESGILGAVAGVLGTLQAAEIIKLITGIGEPLTQHVLMVDARTMQFRRVKLNPAPTSVNSHHTST